MKKLLALLLAAIMVLSLAACASTATTDAPAQTTEAADTTTETAAEAPAESTLPGLAGRLRHHGRYGHLPGGRY